MMNIEILKQAYHYGTKGNLIPRKLSYNVVSGSRLKNKKSDLISNWQNYNIEDHH